MMLFTLALLVVLATVQILGLKYSANIQQMFFSRLDEKATAMMKTKGALLSVVGYLVLFVLIDMFMLYHWTIAVGLIGCIATFALVHMNKLNVDKGLYIVQAFSAGGFLASVFLA